MNPRPTTSNPDEWRLFLSRQLDNRATHPSGLTYVAMQISEAVQHAFDLGFRAAGGSIIELKKFKATGDVS